MTSPQYIRSLKKGGQGEVVLFEFPDEPKFRAVKFFTSNPEGEKRFNQGLKMLLSLQHPNIIEILDSGKNKHGNLYYIMPYYKKGSLARFIGKAYNEEAVYSLIYCIASALACAHEQLIIHRDLKPDNILLSDTGFPIVCDWDLAKDWNSTESLTQIGSPFGTLQYSAPEVISGDAKIAIPCADVYSLGIIFLELLTAGKSRTTDLPRVFNTNVRNVISKMIQLDQKNRYQSIEEFWADFIAPAPPKKILTVKKTPQKDEVTTEIAPWVGLLAILGGAFFLGMQK